MFIPIEFIKKSVLYSKPDNLLYIADGVAPRAKMNNNEQEDIGSLRT